MRVCVVSLFWGAQLIHGPGMQKSPRSLAQQTEKQEECKLSYSYDREKVTAVRFTSSGPTEISSTQKGRGTSTQHSIIHSQLWGYVFSIYLKLDIVMRKREDYN